MRIGPKAQVGSCGKEGLHIEEKPSIKEHGDKDGNSVVVRARPNDYGGGDGVVVAATGCDEVAIGGGKNEPYTKEDVVRPRPDECGGNDGVVIVGADSKYEPVVFEVSADGYGGDGNAERAGVGAENELVGIKAMSCAKPDGYGGDGRDVVAGANVDHEPKKEAFTGVTRV